MSTITQTFESLCDKEFEMGRVDAYENLDREIAALKHQFSAKGALFSSNLAQAVVDVILKRFDVVLTAFENAYLNKWGATDRDLTETDMEWLKAKVSSKLDFEILQARTRAQNAFGATPAFAQFAGQAEVKARERHMRVFQKLDILKLRKEQAGMKKEAKEISPATAAKAMDANFIWEELHPAVVRIAKSRVESGNFADAVEACLKEVNDRIKKFVREKTAKEFDGADLMNRAFSLQTPSSYSTIRQRRLEEIYRLVTCKFLRVP